MHGRTREERKVAAILTYPEGRNGMPVFRHKYYLYQPLIFCISLAFSQKFQSARRKIS
jgi:hypothetical protein